MLVERSDKYKEKFEHVVQLNLNGVSADRYK